MNFLSNRLKGFERRVRLVRAWRGLAIGACCGAALSAVWAVLDWRSVIYTEWAWMGLLTGVSALVGAVVGFAAKVPIERLAQSVDRRAGLEDRLVTAQERAQGGDSFDEALRADADGRLAAIQPKVVYPIKVGRWHAGALLFAALAAAFFVLGNTPIALSDEARKDRDDLKKQGQVVERVLKQNFETPDAKQEMSDEEKRLADELRKFDRDLEKGHISKEESLQKANDLAQKADELEKKAAQTAQQTLAQAQSVREQMEKGEAEKAGLQGLNMQMADMSPGERQEQIDRAKAKGKELDRQIADLQKQLEALKAKLAQKNLSAAERKALEEQKSALEKKLKSLLDAQKSNNETLKQLELSKEAQEVFKKMMQDPLFKELMELEKKLARNSDPSSSKSGRPKLTDEDLKRIKEKLEELAKQLKDEKAMKEYLEALLEAMRKAKKLGNCNGACLGIKGLISLGGNSMEMSPAGPGSPSEDIWMGDQQKIHKLDKAVESRGTTSTEVISGDPRQATGPQRYIEIRAPSTVGNRSSVPYRDVLPSYRKKAESALNKQQIPKEHQKRVKDYFDSLTGANRSK